MFCPSLRLTPTCVFESLSNEDLVALGVASLSHRRLLLAAAAKLGTPPAVPRSHSAEQDRRTTQQRGVESSRDAHPLARAVAERCPPLVTVAPGDDEVPAWQPLALPWQRVAAAAPRPPVLSEAEALACVAVPVDSSPHSMFDSMFDCILAPSRLAPALCASNAASLWRAQAAADAPSPLLARPADADQHAAHAPACAELCAVGAGAEAEPAVVCPPPAPALARPASPAPPPPPPAPPCPEQAHRIRTAYEKVLSGLEELAACGMGIHTDGLAWLRAQIEGSGQTTA